MLVIRGTAAFRKRVSGTPLRDGDEATGLLGEWFANVRLWRPHLAIFVHRETYLPVLVPLAPASGVIQRFGDQLEQVLLNLGARPDAVARERQHRTDVRIAPTDDRSVVGVMTEYLHMLDWWRDDLGGIDESNALPMSLRLSDTPVRAGSRHATWPDRAMLARLDGT